MSISYIKKNVLCQLSISASSFAHYRYHIHTQINNLSDHRRSLLSLPIVTVEHVHVFVNVIKIIDCTHDLNKVFYKPAHTHKEGPSYQWRNLKKKNGIRFILWDQSTWDAQKKAIFAIFLKNTMKDIDIKVVGFDK